MPHSSFFRNHGKTSRTPRRPFEKQRLDIEMKLIGEFGLKNKREVWRTQLALARIRKAARVLLTLDEKDPKRMFEGSALLRSAACRRPAARRPPGAARCRAQKLGVRAMRAPGRGVGASGRAARPSAARVVRTDG